MTSALIRLCKIDNIALYAQNPEDHQQFINMHWVFPGVFQVLLHLIAVHPVFQNNSNTSQKPVEVQLATTLYHMGVISGKFLIKYYEYPFNYLITIMN